MRIQARICKVVCILMIWSVIGVHAEGTAFKDVSRTHWAYESINKMVYHGVINGYEDGNFKPDVEVKRDEFAKMMVKTLGLEKGYASEVFFVDVDSDYWAYKYIEASKSYLTGYHSESGFKFKPREVAVREDMAVALVKALSYDMSDYSISTLNGFADTEAISENLKKYVAIAVEKGIMNGSSEHGTLKFKPLSPLTRAEAAVLLGKLIPDQESDEKIVVGEVINSSESKDADEKVNSQTSATIELPVVSVEITDDTLYIQWHEIKSSQLKGYKVVASIGNNSPVYPADGYYKWITNASTTSVHIKAGDNYNNGDVGQFRSGVTYYVSVTALYHDGSKVSGNVKRVTMP